MLYLIRGVPGKGKTTYAKSLECLAVEADHWNVRNGKYDYDHTRVAAAHEWCFEQAKAAIDRGMDIAIVNTFAHLKFLIPYVEYARARGCPVTIVECWYKGKTQHPVPDKVIAVMLQTWEDIPAEWLPEVNLVFPYGKRHQKKRNAHDLFQVGENSEGGWA